MDASVSQTVPEKQCPACGNSYPATTDYFNARPRYASSDGLHSHCRSCRKELRKHPKKQRTVSQEDFKHTELGIEVPLTKGKVTLIDECDLDLCVGCKWSYGDRTTPNAKKKRYVEEAGFAKRRCLVDGKPTTLRLHNLVMEKVLGGPIPEGYLVDHESSNPLDNRRENLRLATPEQNARNSVRHGRGSNPYKGVSYDNGKHPRIKRWSAKIHYQGKNITLGRFYTPEEAALAYNKAAREYYGEFAKLNDLAS